MNKTWLITLTLLSSACSQSETEQARHNLKTSGEELKKEIKSDARAIKKEAVKAGHQARDEARKATKELDNKN